MTTLQTLASFAASVEPESLPEPVLEAAKRQVLDTIAVSISRRDDDVVDSVRGTVGAFNRTGKSRLWGTDWGAAAPDAGFHNAVAAASGNASVFFSPTLGWPSACVPAVLAAGEATNATGPDLLAGLAAAYEVHGELAWRTPLDGLDPATHVAIAAAAGAGRARGYGRGRLESTIGIAASRPTHAVDTPFAGVATGLAVRDAVCAAALAGRGLIGPADLSGGFWDSLAAVDLDLDPGCERVRDAAVLPHAVHPYAQSAVEATIDIGAAEAIDPAAVSTITVETCSAAADVLEPAAVGVALVDRELSTPGGRRVDTEPVADRVRIEAVDELDDRFDRGELPAHVTVACRDGDRYEEHRQWFTGHPAVPSDWGDVEAKFNALTAARYDEATRDEIIATTRRLEAETAAELTRLLA